MVRPIAMCGVYKITSPIGKLYIGQSMNIEKRWNTYKKLYSAGPKLFNSLKKYGPDNHIFEIIELCDIDSLLARETFWKIYYDVLNVSSLCCRLDGKGGRLSEETKRKMSVSFTGRIHTKNQIEKNKINQPRRRPILQFDLDNNLIAEWLTIQDAIKEFKGKAFIPGCLLGKQKTAGGFIWRYKDNADPQPRIGGPKKGKESKSKGKLLNSGTIPVSQFDLNGNLINHFKSISEAEYHFPCNGIGACCRGKQKTAAGYKWVYKI